MGQSIRHTIEYNVRVCRICNIEKPINEFQFRKDNNTYRSECKICRYNSVKIWCKRTGYNQERYSQNKLKMLEKNKQWRLKNKDRRCEYNKNYGQLNKDLIRERNREYQKKKRLNDPCFKLRKNTAERIRKFLKSGKAGVRTLELVGCNINDLMNHIEKQFKDGMTWGNYGYYGWHIDHITPVSRFDLTNPEELKKAFHYTNLQPLWWIDNLKKGNR